MQFAVISLNVPDLSAAGTPAAVRGSHRVLAKTMNEQKYRLPVCALLDDCGEIVRSLRGANLKTREALDKWLKIELCMLFAPYPFQARMSLSAQQVRYAVIQAP